MADSDVKSLIAKFGQTKAMETTGNAVRNRRGYTNGSTPNSNNQSTQQSSAQKKATTPPAQQGTLRTSNNSNTQTPTTKQSNPPSKTGTFNMKKPEQNQTSPQSTQQQTNSTPTSPPAQQKAPQNPPAKSGNLMGSMKATSTPSTNTQHAQPPTLPPKKTVVVPPKPVVEDDEVQLRTKPLNRPKVDPNRKSQHFSPLVITPAEPVEIESPKPSINHAPAISKAPSNSNLNFEVSDKYKINYDELEFDQLVSSGSAGEVYLGYYFGTPVAIKKLFALAPDQKHLVYREFSMLQTLTHPNIVQFLGICDHSSGIYLITEYVENGDLFDLLIFGDKEINWRSKVKIALQVATACYYLHSRNIIHRDLKSQNVLIGENFKIKLCDLGLATILENKKRMTVCGTDEWMAPEIVVSETYDSKVDVFSFGIVITEMINQQPPRKRDFASRFAFDVEAFSSSIPEECPEELAKLVIDCCKYEPQERPSFKEIVPRLKKILEMLPED